MPWVSTSSTAIFAPPSMADWRKNGLLHIQMPVVWRSVPPRHLKPKSTVGESTPLLLLPSWSRSPRNCIQSMEVSLGNCLEYSRYRRKKLRRKLLPVRKLPTTLTTATFMSSEIWSRTCARFSSSNAKEFSSVVRMIFAAHERNPLAFGTDLSLRNRARNHTPPEEGGHRPQQPFRPEREQCRSPGAPKLRL
eukprot:scaffold8585_cov258-Pinguiococcus_pyrenoidosus.AAC.4